MLYCVYMNIAIISDSHNHFDNLTKTVAIANKHDCQLLLHAGDLGGPGWGVSIMSEFQGRVVMTPGNCDGELVGLARLEAKYDNFELGRTTQGGYTFEETIDTIRIYMHHYPRPVEIAAHSGLFDLCIFGHTHTYHEERVGETLLLNPSSLHPWQTTPSMVIYDTATRKHERVMM